MKGKSPAESDPATDAQAQPCLAGEGTALHVDPRKTPLDFLGVFGTLISLNHKC